MTPESKEKTESLLREELSILMIEAYQYKIQKYDIIKEGVFSTIQKVANHPFIKYNPTTAAMAAMVRQPALGHATLDVAGFVADAFGGSGAIFDGANAGLYLARGMFFDAALSIISMLPGIGDVVGKLGRVISKIAGSLGKSAKLAKAAKGTGLAAKTATKVSGKLGQLATKKGSEAAAKKIINKSARKAKKLRRQREEERRSQQNIEESFLNNQILLYDLLQEQENNLTKMLNEKIKELQTLLKKYALKIKDFFERLSCDANFMPNLPYREEIAKGLPEMASSIGVNFNPDCKSFTSTVNQQNQEQAQQIKDQDL